MSKKAPKLGDEVMSDPVDTPIVTDAAHDPTVDVTAQSVVDAAAKLNEARATLAKAEADHVAAVAAATPPVPAFDEGAPTILLEDGSILDAPLGTKARDRQVTVANVVYDHVADHANGRWVYRSQAR